MIYFLVRRYWRDTIDGFLESSGAALRDRLRVITYERALRSQRLPAGRYIFADIERLEPREAEIAAELHAALCARPDLPHPLNHPTRSRRRYALLRSLHETGQNTFDVYRADEQRTPRRFPVFVRGENDHHGAQTPLLPDAAALDRALADFDAAGRSRQRLLVTEHLDVGEPDGERRLYAKHSAFCIGGQVIARHLFFGEEWMLKTAHLLEPALLERERDYVMHNPHRESLERIFSEAGIDYGRIDYGLLEGRIQVWEINTNPWIASDSDVGLPQRQTVHDHFVSQLNAALAEVAAAPCGGPPLSDWMSHGTRKQLRLAGWRGALDRWRRRRRQRQRRRRRRASAGV